MRKLRIGIVFIIFGCGGVGIAQTWHLVSPNKDFLAPGDLNSLFQSSQDPYGLIEAIVLNARDRSLTHSLILQPNSDKPILDLRRFVFPYELDFEDEMYITLPNYETHQPYSLQGRWQGCDLPSSNSSSCTNASETPFLIQNLLTSDTTSWTVEVTSFKPTEGFCHNSVLQSEFIALGNALYVHEDNYESLSQQVCQGNTQNQVHLDAPVEAWLNLEQYLTNP